MNKYYLWIARFESFFISVIVAYGTFLIVGVGLIVAVERMATITINEFSLVCAVTATFFIWFFSIFKAFEITNTHFEKWFKIDGIEK